MLRKFILLVFFFVWKLLMMIVQQLKIGPHQILKQARTELVSPWKLNTSDVICLLLTAYYDISLGHSQQHRHLPPAVRNNNLWHIGPQPSTPPPVRTVVSSQPAAAAVWTNKFIIHGANHFQDFSRLVGLDLTIVVHHLTGLLVVSRVVVFLVSADNKV